MKKRVEIMVCYVKSKRRDVPCMCILASYLDVEMSEDKGRNYGVLCEKQA